MSDEQCVKEVNIDDIIIRKDLHCRSSISPGVVEQYSENIEMLPPIEINQDNILIDGLFRLWAHEKVGLNTIKVFITKTDTELEVLEFSIERNCRHGSQLTEEEKCQTFGQL